VNSKEAAAVLSMALTSKAIREAVPTPKPLLKGQTIEYNCITRKLSEQPIHNYI